MVNDDDDDQHCSPVARASNEGHVQGQEWILGLSMLNKKVDEEERDGDNVSHDHDHDADEDHDDREANNNADDDHSAGHDEEDDNEKYRDVHPCLVPDDAKVNVDGHRELLSVNLSTKG